MASPPVAFVHIAKTAGGTLHHIGVAQYPDRQVVRLSEDARDHPVQLADPDVRRRLDDAQFVSGHMSVDMERWIGRPVQLLTMLRDPVERVVSHYFWMRDLAKGDSPAKDMARSGTTLADYVREPAVAELENGQVRQLAGGLAYGSMPVDRPVSDDDVARAVANLDRAVVGLQERFEESIARICQQFGWVLPDRRKDRNVNRSRPSLADLPRAQVAAVEASAEPDRALYTAAVERF